MKRLALLALFILPASAQAARFDPPPAATTPADTPVTFTLRTDGMTQSSGVAYKLDTETAWHRCLADGATVTINVPAGSYRVDIADDTSRPWFDANAQTSTTPECAETTAPKNAPLNWVFFSVQAAPRAPVRAAAPRVVDSCGDELDRVAALHVRAEFAADRYGHRHTKARRRAMRTARSKYLRARRTYLNHC